MSVTGYLALYTTLLGWQQYNNLWQIAVGTGLIYLPFIGIILQSAIGPFTSMGAKDAAQIAVRRLMLNVVSALFVIAFAAMPTVPLDPKVLHYDPLCTQGAKPATPGDTGTTYDNAFSVPTGVKVPILWYFVMAFSNGVTHAANVGLPCAPIDYRALHSELDTSSIQDPELKKEVVQFYNDCYIPSYSAYLGSEASAEKQNQIDQLLTENGKEDVGWLGSQTLLKIDGFYDSRSATTPVKGFPFDAMRDIEESQVPDSTIWGRPDCKAWWQDAENGLFKKLKEELPPNFLTNLMHLGGDTEKVQLASINSLINHSFHSGQSIGDQLRGYESLDNNSKGDFVSRYLGAPIGVLYESLSFYPKLHLLINALPIIQGSLLFALYAFLAFAMPFSSYKVGFCLTASVMMFSLIFCSYLWQLVQWFDNYLIQALYPSLGDVAGLGILNADSGKTTNQLFVEMIVGSLYVVLPLLWMTVMGWVGFELGSFVTGLLNRIDAVSKSAGDNVSSIARKKLP
jgi:hypothetical protein